MVEFQEINDKIQKRFKKPDKDEPQGWIQWKGTDVCIDIHCSCGYHGHIDDYFSYYYHCCGCGKKFALNPHIQLVELDHLDDEEIKYLAEKAVGFKFDAETCEFEGKEIEGNG